MTLVVENLSNGTLCYPPEWAQTPEAAMTYAGVFVATARGNIQLEGTPESFTLRDWRGAAQEFRVVEI